MCSRDDNEITKPFLAIDNHAGLRMSKFLIVGVIKNDMYETTMFFGAAVCMFLDMYNLVNMIPYT